MINLGLEAQAVFDGQTEIVLSKLAIVGSLVALDLKRCFIFKQGILISVKREEEGDESWLIKFTSKNLPLATMRTM